MRARILTNGKLASRERYDAFLSRMWKQHLAPRTANASTVVSTFAGCGGSSLGYSMAGYRELLAVEWDKYAANTFHTNFPDVPQYVGDIFKLDNKEALQLAGVKEGELDLFDGSPPCQGFSTSGKRNTSDPRNLLFRQYIRLLNAFKPRAFVMENVAGMVRGRMRPFANEALKDMQKAGYVVNIRILNAMYYSVPHSRPRVIFVGVRKDVKAPPFVFPAAVTPAPISISTALRGLGDKQNASIDHVWVCPKQSKSYFLAAKRKLQGEVLGKRLDVRRDSWNKPAYCLSALTGSQVGGPGCIHPLYTRKYSALEFKLLASFPPEFDFSKSGNSLLAAVYKQVGNCVPPLFMYAIARAVRETVFDI